MRITIKWDSADTEEARTIIGTTHRVTDGGPHRRCEVGLNGAKFWAGETPPLSPWQALAVLWRLARRCHPQDEARASGIHELDDERMDHVRRTAG